MTRFALGALSAIALMAAATAPTFAQAGAGEHMIKGAPVPADQVQRVQDYCTELAKAGGPGGTGSATVGTQTTAETATTPAGNATAATPSSTTTAGDTTQNANTVAAGAATENGIDWTVADMGEIIDYDSCIEGGFIDAAAVGTTGAGAAGTTGAATTGAAGAGGAATTTTTTTR